MSDFQRRGGADFGASRGIGDHVGAELLRQGWTVSLACARR